MHNEATYGKAREPPETVAKLYMQKGGLIF